MVSNQRLKVMIIGAGEVGLKAAERLNDSENNVDVVLLELNDERFAYASKCVDCRIIHGSGLDPEVLERAELASFDLLYAVTDSDEVNLLACQLAREVVRRATSREMIADALGGDGALDESREVDLGLDEPEGDCSPLGESEQLKQIPARSVTGRLALFARVRSYSLYDHLKHLYDHVNIILPEVMCAEKIEDLIQYPQLAEALELESQELKLYGVKIHERAPVVGQSLRSFTQDLQITIAAFSSASTLKGGVMSSPEVSAIGLRKKRELVIPHADHEMSAGDILYFVASPAQLPRIHAHFCDPEQPQRAPLAIAGKNSIARDIFNRLVTEGEASGGPRRDISVLSESYTFADKIEAGDREGDSTVILGSVTHLDDLRSIGVGPGMILLVCSQDEENLICALLARELGCEHILIINNREQYTTLIQQLGFDGILSPRQLATHEITHQTLKYSSQALQQSGLTGDDVEVRSFVIDSESELCGVPLKELSAHGFPREHAVIAAILDPERDAHIMPTGEDLITAHSTVYVVARSSHFPKIKSLFGKRKSRFKLW